MVAQEERDRSGSQLCADERCGLKNVVMVAQEERDRPGRNCAQVKDAA
jgi:hypothetical protein